MKPNTKSVIKDFSDREPRLIGLYCHCVLRLRIFRWIVRVNWENQSNCINNNRSHGIVTW